MRTYVHIKSLLFNVMLNSWLYLNMVKTLTLNRQYWQSLSGPKRIVRMRERKGGIVFLKKMPVVVCGMANRRPVHYQICCNKCKNNQIRCDILSYISNKPQANLTQCILISLSPQLIIYSPFHVFPQRNT